MKTWAHAALGAIAGAAAAAVIVVLSGTSTKRLAVAVAAAAFLFVVAVSSRRKRLCIIAFTLLVPLNINYFLFGLYALPPHIGGAVGLYLIPADLPLALLYVIWMLELAGRHDVPARPPGRAMLLFLPFLLWSALSMLYGTSHSWAFYEWFRWVKVSLVLLYVSTRFTMSDVWLTFHALAGAVLAQAGLGVLQTGLRRNFGLDRLGIAGKGSEDVFVQGVGAAGDVVRAAGTLGHPNVLGSYLVFLLPVFLLFWLVDEDRRRKWWWFAVLVIGTAGLAATMSRTAWLCYVVACGAALAMGVATRLLDARRIVALTLCAIVLAGAALLPFYSVIVGRVNSDLVESINVRAEWNMTAIEIAMDHPVLGVGLNNYTLIYPEYAPERAAKMKREEGAIAVVHNLYLLVWSEIGTVGFVTFFLFWGGMLWTAFRAVPSLSGLSAAAVIGVATGLAGLLLGDLTGFSLWLDSNMYTGALLLALVQPLVAARSRRRPVPAPVRAVAGAAA